MIYNENEFNGVMSSDNMCLDVNEPSTCLSAQPFFLIDTSENDY